MDYQVVDKGASELLAELKRRIHRLQSGGTIDSLIEIGADTQKQIGASYVSLKDLASHYEPNEQVSLMLWDCGRREEQIVACFLFPDTFNKEKIMQLLETSMNMEVAGYFGSIYLYKHSQLLEMIKENLSSGTPFQQVALLTAMARHRIVNKEKSIITKEYFKELVHKSYDDPFVRMVAERYRFNV